MGPLTLVLLLPQAVPPDLSDPLTPGRGNPSLNVLRYELELELDPPEPRLEAGRARLEAEDGAFAPCLVEVRLLGPAGERRDLRLRWEEPRQEWPLELPFRPVEALLDPDGILPRGRG